MSLFLVYANKFSVSNVNLVKSFHSGKFSMLFILYKQMFIYVECCIRFLIVGRAGKARLKKYSLLSCFWWLFCLCCMTLYQSGSPAGSDIFRVSYQNFFYSVSFCSESVLKFRNHSGTDNPTGGMLVEQVIVEVVNNA